MKKIEYLLPFGIITGLWLLDIVKNHSERVWESVVLAGMFDSLCLF